MPVAPPISEDELMSRARAVSGQRLGDLGAAHGVSVPPDLRRAKGWVGNLMERLLGATATRRSVPDFEKIGVELKTLPVSSRGVPLESTFVCTIPLGEVGDVEWEESRVFRKIRRVLWMPVQGERQIPVGERMVGAPLLWSPSDAQCAQLRFDWEELAGVIGRGDVESITGHLGVVLQVRPKAANAASRRRGVDQDGANFATLPRGFYLRSSFTRGILADNFSLPEVRRP